MMFKWLAKKILTQEAVIGYAKDGRRSLPVDEILNEKVDHDDFVTCEKCKWKILEDNAVKGEGEVRKRQVHSINPTQFRANSLFGCSVFLRDEDFIYYPYYCKGKCEPEKDNEIRLRSIEGLNGLVISGSADKITSSSKPLCKQCGRIKGEVKRCNGKKHHKWK